MHTSNRAPNELLPIKRTDIPNRKETISICPLRSPVSHSDSCFLITWYRYSTDQLQSRYKSLG